LAWIQQVLVPSRNSRKTCTGVGRDARPCTRPRAGRASGVHDPAPSIVVTAHGRAAMCPINFAAVVPAACRSRVRRANCTTRPQPTAPPLLDYWLVPSGWVGARLAVPSVRLRSPCPTPRPRHTRTRTPHDTNFFFHPVCLRPCLVSRKFCKIFQIPRHIESLDTCMKH
jgi:hypothetical protein